MPMKKILIFILVILFLILSFWSVTVMWGSGQQLTPSFVSKKLQYGQTIDQVKQRIDLAETSCEATSVNNKGYYCTLSTKGIGSWFVAQHSTSIMFDENDRLVRVIGHWFYQIEESTEVINFKE